MKEFEMPDNKAKLFINQIINIKSNSPENYYRIAKNKGRLFFMVKINQKP